MDCAHDGFHSVSSEYDREQGILRYFRSCDDCGRRLAEVYREEYRPVYDPNGNDPHISPSPA